MPAAADTTEWSTINTPSWEDGVILPASDILDYDISGEDGNTIYVVAEVDRACADENPFLDEIDDDDDDDRMTALQLRSLQVHRRRCHLERHHPERH